MKQILRFILAGAACVSLALHAAEPASSYPSKPVRSIVGYAPGGGSDIVMKINNAVNTIVKSPEFNKRLAQLGADPVAESPEYFANFLKSEIERWAPVVKASGAKPE